MHGQCLVSLIASLLHVRKTPLYSIMFTCYVILFLTLAMSACGLVWFIFVMLKLPYLNYSKSLIMQLALNFPKGCLARTNFTAVFRVNNLAAK